ncbi:hypothetical protein CSOJ01_05361 [Colletotrichum sojae]|uniref:Uncharacterized protein n=1 Tax=Colletotrichum sojae TaxID=2175907 RepID=A0A8H6JFC7_9PEZI|nr:hypothetical protein CSOJ01_05361 [Colletotrichum sojae]
METVNQPMSCLMRAGCWAVESLGSTFREGRTADHRIRYGGVGDVDIKEGADWIGLTTHRREVSKMEKVSRDGIVPTRSWSTEIIIIVSCSGIQRRDEYP